MTQEEIVKYTDHLLAEFYKDCQKQYNKDNRQIDIVLSNGDFSTLQNILCEAITNIQHQSVNKACEWLKENLFEGYDPDNYPMVRCYNIDMEDFIEDFSREMEE